MTYFLILLSLFSGEVLARNFKVKYINHIDGLKFKKVSVSRRNREVTISGEYKNNSPLFFHSKEINRNKNGFFKETFSYKRFPISLRFTDGKKSTARIIIPMAPPKKDFLIAGLDVTRFIYKENTGEKLTRTFLGPSLEYHHFWDEWSWQTRLNSPLIGTSSNPDIKLLYAETSVIKFMPQKNADLFLGGGIFYGRMFVSPSTLGHSELLSPEIIFGAARERWEAKIGYIPLSSSNLNQFSNFFRVVYNFSEKYGFNFNYQVVRTEADDIKIYYDLIQLGLFSKF